MESGNYDPTLPLDFDGSCNMLDLPEVTLGADSSFQDLSKGTSHHTLSPGSGLLFPNVVKSTNGRMSPVRGRTMKEYDQQITDLKKENFSLKLRIYFLEERMQQKYGDGEDVFKTNIELKVNVQSLKKELEDKQELLRKASQAMETLTSSQESDIDSVRKSLEEQHHKYTEELRSDLQKALQDAQDAREEMEEGRERMNQLELQIQQLETKCHHSEFNTQKLQNDITMKEREISALQLESDSQERGLQEAQRLLQEVEAERDAAQNKLQQMEKDLQRRGRDVEQLSTALKDTSMIDGHSFLAPSHLQDVVDDQRDNLDQLQAKVKQLEGQLREKEDLIGTLEEEGKEREKGLKDATNQLQQLTQELEQEKKLGGRRDKTIQGLVSSLHKKEKEVTSAKARLSKSEGALKTLRAELHEAEMTNHQDELGQAREQLKESENSNQRLQTQLTDANLQVENMIKSLGKKEGELAGFREQLDKANQALKRSEEALEGLQEQLEKERKDAHNRLDKQAQEFQRASQEYMQQLQGKDSLMANMTSQLHAKDQQLSSLMDLLTDDTNKGQKVLLQRLEDDLNQSTGLSQSALEEKQAELDRKGKELRDTRQALRDKGRELEQAQLQLLDKQEELEKLELRNRQQGEATAHLSKTLAKAQQRLEEALERHGEALQDKDAIVSRLQKALAEKERMIEELSQASPSTDKQQQQLRGQLREKEQLVQELQTDCVRAACEREQAARKSQAQLMEKEEEILALNKKQQKELLNRDQELQKLHSELARKDMEVEGAEARLTETLNQHKEALNTLHTALAHKDSTIKALVDSVGEKERLLRRSQQNLTEDAKAQIAEMDTLMADNARLKRLLREKDDALQEALYQRNRHDNRESHHTSYHETITHTNNTDNAQVVRLLEEQIRETHALSELLRQDRHQVLVNLTSDHRHSDTHSREEGARLSSEEALQAELSAVSALRQRLQDSVEKHRQLHRSLLGHPARYADHVASGESSPESGSDRPLLNIPDNRSHPQHQQQQHHHHNLERQEDQLGDEVDGCPGLNPSLAGSESGVWGHRLTADAAHTSGEIKPGGSSSLAVQTSPFLTHGLFEQGGPLSRPDTVRLLHSPPVLSGAGEGETSQTQLLERSLSQDQALGRQWSQDSVLSSLSSLSSAQLAGMSAPVLRDLVSQLQEDLITTAQHNAALTRQLQAQGPGQGVEGTGRSTTMENGEMSTSEELHAQVDSLKTTLKLKEAETAQLREHLGLSQPQTSTDLPSPAHLHQQVRNLRHQVKDMNKVNDTLKQAVNGKSPANPEGFDPQQLVNMALEIERLKADNARLTSQIKKPEAGDVRKESGMKEMALPGDAYDGNGALGEDTVFTESAQSPDCVFSPLSPQLSAESFSQELSRNTNRHTDSCVSQISDGHQWNSTFGRSISQSSQSEMEWAPRVMREGNAGSKLPPLAKMKLNGKETAAGSQPLINVSRRLHDSQQQFYTSQVRMLEDRLMATEGTVRFMSKRLRHFRSLLQAGKGGGDSKATLAGYGLPRSQSESSIFPQAGLSLSLSCSDLREAAGGMGGGYGSSTDLVSMATQGGAAQPSVATSSEGQQGQGGSSRPHAILDTLNQHIKAMKDRYPQLAELGKSAMAQAGGNHSHTQLEEDGGSNMSCLSSQHSRENLRRDALPHRDILDRQTSRTGKDTGVMSDNTTNVTLSQISDSLFNSRHTVGCQGNSVMLPPDVTLGEDLPDCTMDNLTYFSFSESILPLGSSQGHYDSAWSLPSCVSGTDGRDVRGLQTSKPDHSPENAEPGSSGDEATFDGNRLSQSNTAGEDSMSQNESSRLQTRVMVLTDMNRTLREELNVYDTLCRSLGVQVSVEGTGVGESGEESCDGEMRLLQLHLAELKRLRARLEQLDTDAHNAVQVTSLLNNQHIRRISQLEAALQHLKDQLAQKQALADHRETLIFEHERVISESRVLQEHQEKETQLLRDNLAALQDCEQQRKQQQEAEVAELTQQVETLRTDLDDARRQVKDLEEDLEESQQRRQSYDVRFTQSQQHLQDIEDELARAKRRAKSLEAELHKSQMSCQDLQSQLSSAKSKMNTLDDDLRLSRQSCKKLEFEVKKSTQFTAVMESKLTRTEEEKVQLAEDLSSSQESLQAAEEELTQLRHQTEELNVCLHKEKGRADKLESQLNEVRAEKGEVEDLASRSRELQEECRQQQQRTQHYQERMAHYEQCMRDYQHRVHECEAQVGQLKTSLESSQSREQDTDGRLHQAQSQVQQLQGQLKDAESRAHTNQSLAHRADTLAKTLEGRLRELEAKVKEWEERCKECEYELRISQTSLSETKVVMDTLKKDAEERSTKLKKRDAQLKKLVFEYKRLVATHKETSQLNQTLKTEIKLYESMTSQTEVSRDKKEELMRQLLTELSQTRRLAEDLISRLEHNKRNDSPASTADVCDPGPEAADGRPSPEPRDSVHSLLSESNILRVHTDTHTSLTASHASSSSERTETQQSQSSVSTPLSSPGSGTFNLNAARSSSLLHEGEASRKDGSTACPSSSKTNWLREGSGQDAEGQGQGHLRSYSHPVSLKYWRDHPMASLAGSSGGPKVEVDSDVRRLFAISGLEGYEKLKRENTELLSTLSAMQARTAERLKAFTGISISESVEYSTLRELQMSAQNLRICAEEESRLLGCFWLTQLPPLNARGEFYDPKLADELVVPPVSGGEPEGGAPEAEVSLRPVGPHGARTARETPRHKRTAQKVGDHAL